MRILIIEDDAEIAALMGSGFERLGHAVTVAETGEKGLSRAENGSHDAIILDLMLPDLDGFSILEKIRGSGNLTPVIVVSARPFVQDKVHCLNSGCDDYLTKPFSFSELEARLNAIVRRRVARSSTLNTLSTITACGLKLDLLERRVFRDGKNILLKPKEFSLLKYLMENAGAVVSRAMIMSEVWGYDFDPGTKIIDVHISYLRDKIYSAFGARLIHTIRGSGYVFRENEEA